MSQLGKTTLHKETHPLQLIARATGGEPSRGTATIAATNQSAVIDVDGFKSITVQLKWANRGGSQSVRLDGSFNGTDWHPVEEDAIGSASVNSTSFLDSSLNAAESNGLCPAIYADLAGLKEVRLTWISGTADSLTINWGLG